MEVAMPRSPFLLLVTLLAMASLATPVEGQLRVGLLGGVSHFDVSKNPETEGVPHSYDTGLVLGGVISLDLSPTARLLLEVTYVQKGYVDDGPTVLR